MTRKPDVLLGASRGGSERRKRGSQPGVARGPYKPRIKAELDVELEYLLKLHPDFAAEYFDEEITSKICSGCDVELDLSYFSPSKNGHGGVKARCKTCCAEAARKRYRDDEGRAARARANARYRAHVAAQERGLKEKAAFVEVASKTAAGRALLAAVGVAHQKDEKC